MTRKAAPSHARTRAHPVAPDTPLLLILLAAVLLLVAQAGPGSRPLSNPAPGSTAMAAMAAITGVDGVDGVAQRHLPAAQNASGPGRMAVLIHQDAPVLAARAPTLTTVGAEKHAGADGQKGLAAAREAVNPAQRQGGAHPLRRGYAQSPARRAGEVLATGPPAGPILL